jgi:hypothetical protein
MQRKKKTGSLSSHPKVYQENSNGWLLSFFTDAVAEHTSFDENT